MGSVFERIMDEKADDDKPSDGASGGAVSHSESRTSVHELGTPLVLTDRTLTNRTGRQNTASMWRLRNRTDSVSRHPPSRSSRVIIPFTEGYTHAANVWVLCLFQGPFSVAPCQPSADRAIRNIVSNDTDDGERGDWLDTSRSMEDARGSGWNVCAMLLPAMACECFTTPWIPEPRQPHRDTLRQLTPKQLTPKQLTPKQLTPKQQQHHHHHPKAEPALRAVEEGDGESGDSSD
jgi:hypothetical protein